ncbi:hypothetical protein PFICI_08208 [Pestalotiopsis fici W106-1]|uniref:Cation/H+ exchanger transmembrane domain-containing protein n=1 Tax=Pestalotiopsis fici (strain W106-1 / CGMCC3.15140) TaxID=1229662 RepID=W3X3U3_PESFW|nr:uncharacterized protein PFICI_08208 [Pestalotiopsis fici W106-1]ETS80679.1 hypothetical protein PFICI_08208 [Pestalotiopsis fici W106-1]
MNMAKRSQIPELEPDGPHLVYLTLSFFLIIYALFSELMRNRLHLSEPPLATLTGIALGPLAADVSGANKWAFQDNITQELARVVTCVQVFAVGLDLPSAYVKRHWRGLLVLLVPNMIFGWLVCTVIIKLVIGISWSHAFIIAATLTPTDPVLSASVLSETKFSMRIPKRIRYILAAESGCNDGTAFPFLYAAIFAVTQNSKSEWAKMFFLETILWQCTLGIVVGAVIGLVANRLLRFSEKRGYTQEATLFVFYFLLAIFATGVGSTLGLDDFLVAFTAGAAFCWDGWFREKTHKMKLPSIIDLLLNSAMFVYFGTIIPWDKYVGFGRLSAWRLLAVTVLVLLFRRLPSIVLFKRLIPETRTWSEAIFAGHFGPMGVGAMFLAMEARARLETGSSTPEPHPPSHGPHHEAIKHMWPIVSFIVLGSIMVHGFSAAIMSVYGHLTRDPKRRASHVGGENDRLAGMCSEDEPGLSSSEDEYVEDRIEGIGQISIR